MSTPILIATTCQPVQVVNGADQCSRQCKHFQSLCGNKCALFGPLSRKPKTKRTYLRAAGCIAAERLARDLSASAQTERLLAAEARGRQKGETGAF